jgi:hypothetical protein
MKSTVPSVQRDEISNLVKNVTGDISIQINDEIDVDILITTAKTSAEEITP